MSTFYAQYPASASGSNASVGTNGAPAPTSSTEVAGINPSGNLQPLQTDAAGNLLVNLNAETGAPLHVIVDSSALPTGAATQTTLATLSTTAASILLDMTNGTQITQITGTVPLPTGASTSALQTTGNTSLASIDGKTPALGQALSAASVPVVLPAAQITALTPPTTVTVTQATGTNLHAVIDNFPATQPISGSVTVTQATGTNLHTVVDSGTITAVTAITNALPAGTNIIGALSLHQSMNVDQINGVAPLVGNGVTGTGSLRVTLASDTSSNTNPLLVGEVTAASSAVTSVAGSATSVNLLASNTARKNAAFYNDSTAIAFLKLGSTASSTSYTVQLVPGAYYELPTVKIYSGAIDCIWASAAGNMRITELS